MTLAAPPDRRSEDVCADTRSAADPADRIVAVAPGDCVRIECFLIVGHVQTLIDLPQEDGMQRFAERAEAFLRSPCVTDERGSPVPGETIRAVRGYIARLDPFADHAISAQFGDPARSEDPSVQDYIDAHGHREISMLGSTAYLSFARRFPRARR